jgi:hypothetical protein
MQNTELICAAYARLYPHRPVDGVAFTAIAEAVQGYLCHTFSVSPEHALSAVMENVGVLAAVCPSAYNFLVDGAAPASEVDSGDAPDSQPSQDTTAADSQTDEDEAVQNALDIEVEEGAGAQVEEDAGTPTPESDSNSEDAVDTDATAEDTVSDTVSEIETPDVDVDEAV